ncbi:MAG: hypothetical protein DMD81_17040 [Candidatus Rokuibacteriota bacterium]|nr:MAG: hypothetical protein DMD81_17040 [Candidatus Rokubacteria bacterium]
MSPALYALAAAFAFAVASIVLKRAFEYARPQMAAVFSVTFTTIFVWAVAVATEPLSAVLTWRILPFVAAGLVAPGLARLLYYLGVHTIGVSRATTLVATQPLVAVGLAVLVLGERPGSRVILGAVAVVAGSALLSARGRDERPWQRRHLVFPFLAAFGFAFRDVISRYGFHNFDNPVMASAVATATSVVVMWSFAALGGAGRTLPDGPVFRLFALAGACEGVAYLLMWRALATGQVSVVSPLVHSQPLFTIVLALIFLRDLERVTWRIVLASALIIAGIALIAGFR